MLAEGHVAQLLTVFQMFEIWITSFENFEQIELYLV